jgi:hypothetical protein
MKNVFKIAMTLILGTILALCSKGKETGIANSEVLKPRYLAVIEDGPGEAFHPEDRIRLVDVTDWEPGKDLVKFYSNEVDYIYPCYYLWQGEGTIRYHFTYDELPDFTRSLWVNGKRIGIDLHSYELPDLPHPDDIRTVNTSSYDLEVLTENERKSLSEIFARFPNLNLVMIKARGKDVDMLTGLEDQPFFIYFDIKDVDWVHMELLKGVDNIRWLEIHSDQFDGRCMQSLAAYPELRELYLYSASVKNKDLVWLSKMESLRKLALSGKKISNTALRHVGKLSNLRTLWLGDCTDAGLIHLRGLRNLGELSLDYCHVHGWGFIYLKDLLSLRELDLSNNPLNDAGLRHLGALVSLRKLNLRSTPIRGRGLRHIKELPNLEDINLRETRLEDIGLKHLRDLPSIKVLNLEYTAISDEGLKYLSDVKTLERLYLSNTQIGNLGVEYLEGLTNLKVLETFNTNVDWRTLRIYEKLPQCRMW